MSGDLDRMEWQNGSMDDFDEDDEGERCLHGVPWCEECAFCNEDEDELDFV